jgi:hypothetical protein
MFILPKFIKGHWFTFANKIVIIPKVYDAWVEPWISVLITRSASTVEIFSPVSSSHFLQKCARSLLVAE